MTCCCKSMQTTSLRIMLSMFLLNAPLAHAAEPAKTNLPPLAAFQQAKHLMRDGQAARAYQLLEVLEFEHAGDTDFDYLIGIAALDSGKADQATLALERVLAREPNLAGARLDMARAWYLLGDFERSRQQLQWLEQQNPPEMAHEMIKQLRAAIADNEKKALRTRRWGHYLEAGTGFDDNVTSVVNDFTAAVRDTYDLPGFEPTGSSIKRSSSTLFVQGGLDVSQNLGQGWSADASLDARGRALPRSQRYSSAQLDARGALQYKRDLNQWRMGLNLQQYWQETDTPNANRRSVGMFGQWLRNLGDSDQLSFTLAASRQRYPDISSNDGDAYNLSGVWLHQYQGSWKPVLLTTLSAGREHAKHLLFNGATNDKQSLILRLFAQITPQQDVDIFGAISYTQRSDRSEYARSPLIANGRDDIADLNLGGIWHFKPDWSLHAQWVHGRTDSNIAINQYRRNEVSLALRCQFQ